MTPGMTPESTVKARYPIRTRRDSTQPIRQPGTDASEHRPVPIDGQSLARHCDLTSKAIDNLLRLLLQWHDQPEDHVHNRPGKSGGKQRQQHVR